MSVSFPVVGAQACCARSFCIPYTLGAATLHPYRGRISRPFAFAPKQATLCGPLQVTRMWQLLLTVAAGVLVLTFRLAIGGSASANFRCRGCWRCLARSRTHQSAAVSTPAQKQPSLAKPFRRGRGFPAPRYSACRRGCVGRRLTAAATARNRARQSAVSQAHPRPQETTRSYP